MEKNENALAIHRVHCGETYIPVNISQKLVEKMNRPELTDREFEILKLVADGSTNKEIGDRLGIGEGTIKMNVKSVLAKMKAPGRTAAVKEATHRGLMNLT
jgi:two-component system NarL family response regulator